MNDISAPGIEKDVKGDFAHVDSPHKLDGLGNTHSTTVRNVRCYGYEPARLVHELMPGGACASHQ